MKANVNIIFTKYAHHQLTFHSFGFLFTRITSCIIPKQHTRNLRFKRNSMKQTEFGEIVDLRCPTTAFKDMFALVSLVWKKMANSLVASPTGRCTLTRAACSRGAREESRKLGGHLGGHCRELEAIALLGQNSPSLTQGNWDPETLKCFIHVKSRFREKIRPIDKFPSPVLPKLTKEGNIGHWIEVVAYGRLI